MLIDLAMFQLYANYKQGTGEDFSKATQPGTFAFQVGANSISHPLPLEVFGTPGR